MRPGRIGGRSELSCRKLRAQLRGHACRPAVRCADRTPERARLGEELSVRVTPHLRVPFERQPRGFADPRAQQHLIAGQRRSLVINLMSQHDPGDAGLCFRRSDRLPMRGRDILHPAEVNGVIDVSQLVDVRAAEPGPPARRLSRKKLLTFLNWGGREPDFQSKRAKAEWRDARRGVPYPSIAPGRDSAPPITEMNPPWLLVILWVDRSRPQALEKRKRLVAKVR